MPELRINYDKPILSIGYTETHVTIEGKDPETGTYICDFSLLPDDAKKMAQALLTQAKNIRTRTR